MVKYSFQTRFAITSQFSDYAPIFQLEKIFFQVLWGAIIKSATRAFSR